MQSTQGVLRDHSQCTVPCCCLFIALAELVSSCAGLDLCFCFGLDWCPRLCLCTGQEYSSGVVKPATKLIGVCTMQFDKAVQLSRLRLQNAHHDKSSCNVQVECGIPSRLCWSRRAPCLKLRAGALNSMAHPTPQVCNCFLSILLHHILLLQVIFCWQVISKLPALGVGILARVPSLHVGLELLCLLSAAFPPDFPHPTLDLSCRVRQALLSGFDQFCVPELLGRARC